MERIDDSAGHAAPPNRCYAAWLALGAVLALAFALRASRMEERSIWYDEALAWRLATFPPAEIVRRTALDVHTPLYFLLLRGWMAVCGESLIALRALSVVCGVLTCLGTYLFTVEAYRHDPRRAVAGAARWMGLCAAAFVAVSVLHIRWSCEARMYTQGTALAAFSSWLLLRALHSQDSSRRWWAAYVLSAIAFAYTHNYAIFSLAAQAIYALAFLAHRCHWRPTLMVRDQTFRRAVASGAVLLAAELCWLPTLLEQRRHMLVDVESSPWRGWTSVEMACYQLFVQPQQPFATRAECTVAAAACLAVLGALLYRPAAGDWFLFVSAALPPAMAIAVSAADVPMFHSHYLVFAHLFLLAAAARLLARIPATRERSLVAAVVVANMLVANWSFWANLETDKKPGVRAAASYLDSARTADEPIVVVSPFYFSPLLYHLNNRRNCYLLDDGEPLRCSTEGPAILKLSDLVTRASLIAQEPSRFWVVNAYSPGTSWAHKPLDLPRAWRAVARKRFQEVYFVQGAVEVVEYRKADHATGGSHAIDAKADALGSPAPSS